MLCSLSILDICEPHTTNATSLFIMPAYLLHLVLLVSTVARIDALAHPSLGPKSGLESTPGTITPKKNA